MSRNGEARSANRASGDSSQSSLLRDHSTSSPENEPYQKKSVEEKSALLDRFPQSQRGWLGNLFNVVVRDGAHDVAAVLRAVRLKANKYLLEPFLSDERCDLVTAFIASLDETEARDYAERVLRYESLPFEERRKVKAARSEEHQREHMRKLPATEKQIAYLRGLGCNAVPKTRAEASRLIDECLTKARQRKAG